MRTMPFFIALVVMLGVHGVSQAAEPYQETELARGSRGEEAAIIKAVEGFIVGFANMDVDMVMDLWDASAADEVSFTQVENDVPVVGLENFRDYYAGHMRHIQILGGEVSDVHIQRMGNLAIVSCRYNWFSKYLATGRVAMDTTRATIVLRKHGRRWLYLNMHESFTAGQIPN
ncbi:YybH family protein [Archangium lansingense]|uniref:Nuclear transport factor 2 family protein n=1 Tax=Archangium lansingense TaxID=2995310 RepID=A0ABT4A0T6_9BACT|nr:nuclear transport factor 2 family protein [Archangium lansinium]MCY1074604.1 nuclear transport factor 2 family protein [Archangium lansinium]